MTSIFFVISRMYLNQFKRNYLKNKKLFLNFLLHFWNHHQFLNIFKLKMVLIADAFPKLGTSKVMVRIMSKKHHFRTPFNSQHVKGSQTLLKSARQHFYHFLPSLWSDGIKFSWKVFLLLIFEILGAHWKPMTRILFVIVRIYGNQFKCIYLALKKTFSHFFALFQKFA